MPEPADPRAISRRFRGFLPVVVDVETGGFNHETDALLELAAVFVVMDDKERLRVAHSLHEHVEPFPGANLEASALAFTGIDPHHPFRFAVDEKTVLDKLFEAVQAELDRTRCSRAILVGHNAFFDLAFLKAAVQRTQHKRNPFHQFSTFDTVSLGALAFGQTVLARAAQAAGQHWDADKAHSAIYDATQTAELFCKVVNRWDKAQQRGNGGERR